MAYRVRPLTDDDCRRIAQWRYPGPWAVYDAPGAPDPADGYYAVAADNDELVGFACFGAEARIPGLEERSTLLDIGVGMRPDLVGQGRGRPFGEVVLEYAGQYTDRRRFRAAVQSWNARSIRLLESLGFTRTGTLDVPEQQQSYAILERDA